MFRCLLSHDKLSYHLVSWSWCADSLPHVWKTPDLRLQQTVLPRRWRIFHRHNFVTPPLQRCRDREIFCGRHYQMLLSERKFKWSVLIMVQLIIGHHWFAQWLASAHAKIYDPEANDDSARRRIFVCHPWPNLLHRLTVIPAWLAWLTNHMPSKVCDEVTYPFPNLSDTTVEVWELISNFTKLFIMEVINYPCCD